MTWVLGVVIVALWLMTYKWRVRVATERDYDVALAAYINAVKCGLPRKTINRMHVHMIKARETLNGITD